jgi:hypothetical protein
MAATRRRVGAFLLVTGVLLMVSGAIPSIAGALGAPSGRPDVAALVRSRLANRLTTTTAARALPAARTLPTAAGNRSSSPTVGPAAKPPPGQNGTVKINGQAIDTFPANQPFQHTCNFEITFRGFDPNQAVSVTFELQSPTLSPSNNTLFSFNTTTDSNGFADINVSLTNFNGATPKAIPGQGGSFFHVELTVTFPKANGNGSTSKHKVFWVPGSCAPSGGTTTTAGGGTTTTFVGGGTTTTFVGGGTTTTSVGGGTTTIVRGGGTTTTEFSPGATTTTAKLGQVTAPPVQGTIAASPVTVLGEHFQRQLAFTGGEPTLALELAGLALALGGFISLFGERKEDEAA